MANDRQLIVGASPHVQAPDDIREIMWSVVIALLPAVGMSIYFFGARAIMVYAVSILAAEVAEMICLRARGKPLDDALDGSACVTGLLMAMVLPVSAAPYVPLVGSAFAIAVCKHCFGGLGNNIWNPALAARVFLQFAYPKEVMPDWRVPQRLFIFASDRARELGAAALGADVQTAATPLAREGIASASQALGLSDLFLGNAVGGCLGETCKLALVIGGAYLIARKIVDWRVPASYVAAVFLLTLILPMSESGQYDGMDRLHYAAYHVLAGGLIIGAFFMATDMVTTPVTPLGRTIFGTGCGLLVVIIRRWGGYPEGVCYSIVLMNTFTPLIDRWVRPRIYGSTTPKPGDEPA